MLNNTLTSESDLALAPITPLIAVEHVFKTVSDSTGELTILRDIDFTLAPQETVAIVGASGSGKSTLTKLVQRLYSPEAGRVLVDGIDISLIDAAQLRRQVGVVLQENLLFNRSIRENIAITDPAAPLEAVIHVATLAGPARLADELALLPAALSQFC